MNRQGLRSDHATPGGGEAVGWNTHERLRFGSVAGVGKDALEPADPGGSSGSRFESENPLDQDEMPPAVQLIGLGCGRPSTPEGLTISGISNESCLLFMAQCWMESGYGNQ